METISAWMIYCFCLLDRVDTLLTVLTCIFGVMSLLAILFILAVWMEPMRRKEDAFIYSVSKKAVCVFFIILSLNTFMPSQKTVAAMYLVPAVVNNESVREVASEVAKGAGDSVKEMARVPEAVSRFAIEWLEEKGADINTVIENQ